MLCQICKEEKLSKEFVYENLSEFCKHPALVCMECALKAVDGKCPYKDCNVTIPNEHHLIEEYKYIIDSMYPDIAAVGHLEVPPEEEDASESQQWIISVVLLTGERLMVQVNKSTTVEKLKESIFQKNGTVVEKQKLIFDEKELELFRKDGSLAVLDDYGMKNNCTVCLLVMLYSVPQHFTDVTFDLHWGYPYSGIQKIFSARKRDYLDASCLVFTGTNHVDTIDYQNRGSVVTEIRHSGDVMDDTKSVGHHTINVNLQKIPRNVTHLFFTLSAWSSPTIQHFPNPSLKFFEKSNKSKDLCSTSFTHAATSQAVIMCSVSRKAGVWQIFSSGKLSAGNAKYYRPLISTISQLISSGI